MYVFPNPSAQGGCGTRSTFKQSLTGFNSVFSFSLIGCLTKAKKPVYPTIYPLLDSYFSQGYKSFDFDLNLRRCVHT